MAMIRVNEDWVIDVDDKNYTVMRDEHKISFNKLYNKEMPQYTNVAYFGKMAHVLPFLAERIAKEKIMKYPEDISLSEAIQEIKDAYQLVADAVENNLP